MASFAFVFKHNPPAEHHVLGNRQDPLIEHRANDVRKPVFEINAAGVVQAQQCYAEAESARVTALT